MRIVLTCNFSPWSRYSGGGQRSTHNLAEALAARGHQVTVVFTKPAHERIAVPRGIGYRLRWAVLLDHRSRQRAPLRPLTAFGVARAVREELALGAEVVHGNGEEAALLPRLRQRGRPFALVVTPRFPSLPATLRADETSLLARAFLSLFHTKYVTLGMALRGADAVSPPSHFASALMQRAYGLCPERLYPVHNGVPTEFLGYRWTEAAQRGPLLFFGRFAYDKGVDTLIEALARLGPRAPSAVLVGRGPERARLEAVIRARGLGDKIVLRDWLTHDQLGAELAQAGLAVLPSRSENFSLAVLAAMAVGTPLVTTPAGGTPEVVDHERTGLLVPAGDAGALASAIARIESAPGWAAGLGAAACAKVRADFTWGAAAQKFEALYERLLTASPWRSKRGLCTTKRV